MPSSRQRREHLVLGVARPQRVLALHRGDRVHRVRAPDRVGAGLRQAEVADLARARPARPSRRPSPRSASAGRRGAGSRGRCGRRRAAAASRRTLRRRTRAAPLMPRAVGSSGSRTMPNLVASTTSSRRPRDRPADQLLVGERAVDVGGVEERDAELERAVDRRDRLVVVARAVELGHAHAAEADGRDGRVPGFRAFESSCRAWCQTARFALEPAQLIKQKLVEPSILSADYARLGEQVGDRDGGRRARDPRRRDGRPLRPADHDRPA